MAIVTGCVSGRSEDPDSDTRPLSLLTLLAPYLNLPSRLIMVAVYLTFAPRES